MTPAEKAARDRLDICAELTDEAEGGDPRNTSCGTADLRLALSAWDAAEKRAELLAAEVKAWRRYDSAERMQGEAFDGWRHRSDALLTIYRAAKAATDAAKCLE